MSIYNILIGASGGVPITFCYFVVSGGASGAFSSIGAGAGGVSSGSFTGVKGKSYVVTIGAGGSSGGDGVASSISCVLTGSPGYGGISGNGKAPGCSVFGCFVCCCAFVYISAYGGGGGGSANGSNGYFLGSYGVHGGAGGAGITSTFTGSSATYAGGGGGAGCGIPAKGAYGGAGGSGGGGNGDGASTAKGTSGAANTGGGGGSTTKGSPNLAGGSGLVSIRYVNTLPDAASTTGSPSFSNTGGYKIYTWTGNGSIIF